MSKKLKKLPEKKFDVFNKPPQEETPILEKGEKTPNINATLTIINLKV